MKEEIIKYETAKLAKEKGFDIPLKMHYENWGETEGTLHKAYINTFNTTGKLQNSKAKGICSAPSQSLLQRWLREEHGIHVEIREVIGNLWTYHLRKLNVYSNDNYNSYEEALEAGLIYALKEIK